MSLKPLILVTNDDGITAPGIRSLVEIMNSIGEVVVVDHDSPKSAMRTFYFAAFAVLWPFNLSTTALLNILTEGRS